MSLVQATILSENTTFVEAMKAYCSMCGVSESQVLVLDDAKEAGEDILVPKASFMLLDWDLGEMPINMFLEAYLNAGKPKTKLPILIHHEEDESLADLAMMYELPFIVIGDITSKEFENNLVEILSSNVFSGDEFHEWKEFEGLLHGKKYDEAKNYLESRLVDNPTEVNYRVNLAEVNIQMRDFKDGKMILKHLIDTNQKSPRIFQMISRCEFALGNKEEAKDYMKACHFLSFENLARLVDIGNIYLKTGCHPEAREIFEEALEIKGGLQEAVVGLGTFEIIDGDFRGALGFIGNTVNKREQSAIFNLAGILLCNDNEFSKAVTLYVNAVKYLDCEKEPEVVAKLFFNMGLAFLKWGKIPKAVRCFEKSYKYDLDFDFAKHNLNVLMEIKRIQLRYGSMQSFIENLNNKKKFPPSEP